MITGTITYKSIDFTFVFNDSELRLIPPKEKRNDIWSNWMMTEISPGVYAPGEPLLMEEEFLKGRCNEDGRKIIFFTRYGADISSFNTVLIVDVTAYIILQFDRDKIDKISFESPETDYIYSSRAALEYSFGESEKNGAFGVKLSDHKSTVTDRETFTVDEKRINVSFSISQTLSTSQDKAPLSVNSCMDFEFEPTDDYMFIYRLGNIAKKFIQYLCFRQNVGFTKTRIYAPYEENTNIAFAEMVSIPEHAPQEQKLLKKGRFIKYDCIKGSIGKLLQSIADRNLYLRHIPLTYEQGRHIDEASFVLITAAFEWEFRKLFPEGIRKSPASAKAEDAASQKMDELIAESRGKLKKIYKYLKKQVESDPLESKIIYTGQELDSVITQFGERLYSMNGEKLAYAKMGKRLAEQRNNFAHGNLDKDFNGTALLDLIYLKWIIYAMQLKYHGVSDQDIQRCINDLFGQGVKVA